MNSAQITTVTVTALAMLILIFWLIRHRMLREKYALTWIFIGFSMLTIPLFFNFYITLASMAGVINSTSFFIFLAIICLLLLSLQFSLSLTSAYKHRKVLTQKLALLEQKLETMEDQLREKKEKCIQATSSLEKTKGNEK